MTAREQFRGEFLMIPPDSYRDTTCAFWMG